MWIQSPAACPPAPLSPYPTLDFLVLPLPCRCRSLWGPTAWGTFFFLCLLLSPTVALSVNLTLSSLTVCG